MKKKTKLKITGNILLAMSSAVIGGIFGSSYAESLIDRVFELFVAVVLIGIAIYIIDKTE